MDREYWENREVTIHWWNMGKKTLDYQGPLKGFLEKKGIHAFDIEGPDYIKGWRFVMSLSSTEVTLRMYGGDYFRAADEAIKVFLTLLGDKAKYISATGMEFFINWI